MQSSSGSSTGTESHGLTVDLDWGIDLRAEALGGGQKLGEIKRTILGPQHLYFKDLINSTSLVAAVSGPVQVAAGHGAPYMVSLPSCYPYKEQVLYRITWTGNASPNASTPAGGIHAASTLGASSLGTGCTFTSSQADCWVDPTKPIMMTLTWPSPGSYTVAAKIVKDKHERAFTPATPTQVHVTVQ